jgi:hypothetical protein
VCGCVCSFLRGAVIEVVGGVCDLDSGSGLFACDGGV